jgi:hypothetical protein
VSAFDVCVCVCVCVCVYACARVCFSPLCPDIALAPLLCSPAASKSVFEGCYELAPAMRLFVQRPAKLHLYPDEMYGTPRLAAATDGSPLVIEGLAQMADYVFKRACGVVQQYDAYAASLTAADPAQQSEDDGASSGNDDDAGGGAAGGQGESVGEAETTRADVVDGKGAADGDKQAPAGGESEPVQGAAEAAAMDSQ